jgi:hypothetical protein
MPGRRFLITEWRSPQYPESARFVEFGYFKQLIQHGFRHPLDQVAYLEAMLALSCLADGDNEVPGLSSDLPGHT